MNRFATLALAAALSAGTATAQQNDFAAILVRAFGTSPSTNSVQSLCGDTFSCTPLTLTAAGGDDVWLTLMGTLNGAYAVIGSFAPASGNGCLNFGIPWLANSWMLPFAPTTLTLAMGTMTTSDRGRCNGGYVAINPILQIPSGLSGFQFTIQGVAGAPLSSGMPGFAFTRSVVIDIP